MVIGLLLAGSVTTSSCESGDWGPSVPTLLIALSMMSVGYSLLARARRTRRRREPD